MDDRWKPLSRTGGPVAPFAKTMTVEQLLAAAPASPVGSRAVKTGRGAESEPTAPDESGTVLHTVTRSDTLMGVALRYGVSVAELRLANDLPSGTENLATTPVLRIPSAPAKRLAEAGGAKAESHAALSRRLRVTHNLAEPEAEYYLTEAGWDYAAAEAALRRDLAFERTAEGRARLAAAMPPPPQQQPGAAAAPAGSGVLGKLAGALSLGGAARRSSSSGHAGGGGEAGEDAPFLPAGEVRLERGVVA